MKHGGRGNKAAHKLVMKEYATIKSFYLIKFKDKQH